MYFSTPFAGRFNRPTGPTGAAAGSSTRTLGRKEARVRLPNGDRAVVAEDKLIEYCLNPAHPRGRNKARVFASALGITRQHAAILKSALLAAAAGREADLGESDPYGQRYTIDFPLAGPGGTATVRSGWIILAGDDIPRMTTCYVL